MNYYLWINGKEQGPYTLEQIQQALDRGDITPQQTARTDESANWEPLEQIAALQGRVPKQASVPIAPAAVAQDSTRQRVRGYLALVRANSCYPALRGLIEVCFGLSIVCVVGGVLMFWYGDVIVGGGFSAARTIALLGIAVLLVVGLVAARQSAFLLIDIADTLLHEHSKNRDG
jgi:hypothetical protein